MILEMSNTKLLRVNSPVFVTLRCFLQKILKLKNELRKSLNRLHHQTKEVESVRGSDLLHLQEVSEGGLALGL